MSGSCFPGRCNNFIIILPCKDVDAHVAKHIKTRYMSSRFLVAVCFIACSSFVKSYAPSKAAFLKGQSPFSSRNISDFTVKRLSGARVFVRWRTEGEQLPVSFEVMRRHKKATPYISLGVVQPKEENSHNSVVEYSFIDHNEYPDSTYYCLRKKNEEGTLFYSLPKAVEGVGKSR